MSCYEHPERCKPRTEQPAERTKKAKGMSATTGKAFTRTPWQHLTVSYLQHWHMNATPYVSDLTNMPPSLRLHLAHGAVLLLLVISRTPSDANAATPSPCDRCWAGQQFNYQLGQEFKLQEKIDNVAVYVVDLETTSKETVDAMLLNDLVPICYFS